MFGAGIKLIDEDEDFFGNLDKSRSNLSDIFGSQPDQQHSLKYVPQKQKNPPDLLAKDRSPGWNIQIAKVVTAYKLVNKENSPQGRIGLAILKSQEGLKKLILYRSKSHVLSTTSLTDDVRLYIKNSYLQFTDDLQVFWSILFENGEENSVLDLIIDYIYKDELNTTKQNKSDNINPPAKEDPSTLNESKEFEKEKSYRSDEKNKNLKENILSRISKMGQALPTLTTQTTTDLSDSSDTEMKKKLANKPALTARKSNKVEQQQIMTVATNPITTNTQMISTVSYNPQILQSASHQESQYLNMLLSENRTQNTEVRMNISKLETKIEKVLDRIDLIQNKSNNNSGVRDLEDEILGLEEKLLELKKENRILRQQIEELMKAQQHLPISLNKYDFKEFEDLIKTFDLNIDKYENPIELFQHIIRNCSIQEKTLKISLEFQENETNELKTHLELLEKEKGQQISDLGQQIEHLESKIIDLENLTETLRKDKEKLFEKLENSDKSTDNIVKTIMNNLYQNLVNNFDDDKVYSTNEILKICANAIKQQTKSAINANRNDK